MLIDFIHHVQLNIITYLKNLLTSFLPHIFRHKVPILLPNSLLSLKMNCQMHLYTMNTEMWHTILNQEVSNMEFKNNFAKKMMTDFYWDSEHCLGRPHLQISMYFQKYCSSLFLIFNVQINIRGIAILILVIFLYWIR